MHTTAPHHTLHSLLPRPFAGPTTRRTCIRAPHPHMRSPLISPSRADTPTVHAWASPRSYRSAHASLAMRRPCWPLLGLSLVCFSMVPTSPAGSSMDPPRVGKHTLGSALAEGACMLSGLDGGDGGGEWSLDEWTMAGYRARLLPIWPIPHRGERARRDRVELRVERVAVPRGAAYVTNEA